MSGAFGSAAEATDRGDASEEEGRPQSHAGNILASGKLHKRELGTSAMQRVHFGCGACRGAGDGPAPENGPDGRAVIVGVAAPSTA